MALGKNRLTIGISDGLAAVPLGRTRAVSRVGATNPALNGAPMHTEAAGQFGLRDAVLVELLHLRALCRSQRCFGVIVHDGIPINRRSHPCWMR